jgi:hypothetical protein
MYSSIVIYTALSFYLAYTESKRAFLTAPKWILTSLAVFVTLKWAPSYQTYVAYVWFFFDHLAFILAVTGFGDDFI